MVLLDRVLFCWRGGDAETCNCGGVTGLGGTTTGGNSAIPSSGSSSLSSSTSWSKDLLLSQFSPIPMG